MDDFETRTIGWLLANARSLPRWAVACLPELSPLALNDTCIVIDSRDLDEDEDVPTDALDLGLSRTLSARSVVSVLDNVSLQLEEPGEEDVLDALNYYLLADAYISFEPDQREC